MLPPAADAGSFVIANTVLSNLGCINSEQRSQYWAKLRRRGVKAIEASSLTKSFGAVRALDNFDLTVTAGTICAQLGPNGAGKTTAIRILATLTRPDAGTASVAGHDIARQAALVRGCIGLAGQHAAVDDDLTGRETSPFSVSCTIWAGALPGGEPTSCSQSMGLPTRRVVWSRRGLAACAAGWTCWPA